MNLSYSLLVLLPIALGQPVQDVDCDLCPDCPAPSKDAVSCNSLMDKMEGINMACWFSGCHSLDESQAVDEATCEVIATKAIPACMVQLGDAKDKCLKDTSVVIREEKSYDAMKACKCQAFQSIRDSLLSVTELLCHSERTPKAWSPTTRLFWFNTIPQVFERIAIVADEEIVEQVNALFQFNLSSDTNYYVDLKNGSGKVGKGVSPEKPDVTITMDADNLLKMFNKELLPTTAFMTGKLTVKGDLTKALTLEKVMKAAREAGK